MTPPRRVLELREARQVVSRSGQSVPVIAVDQIDLAQLLGVNRATVRKWEDLGLPYFRIGSLKRYPVDQVRQWVTEMTHLRAAEVQQRHQVIAAGGSGIRLVPTG